MVEPLPEINENTSEEEKSRILRYLGFEKNLKGVLFHHNQFSRYFRQHVKLVLMNNLELALYNRKKGVYELGAENILNKLIKYFMNLLEDLWNPGDASTALKAIKHDILEIATEFNNGEFINLTDGVLDLNDFSLHQHSPEYLSTVQLPFGYKDNTDTKHFAKYLDDITLGDSELKTVLQEFTGYCLCNSTAAEKAFFLIGNGCNGKSVFAKLLQLLVGEHNYSTTSLSALSGNFGLAQMINTNINVSAENNSGKINSEIFKAIVSGDTVEVNRKYKDALSVQLHTKLVLLFNELPDSSDLSFGFFRKVMIIPFNKTITKDEIDVELINKLELEISGIFHWAIEGLKRLKNNKYQFSPCKVCDQALDVYKKTLNPVAAFFDSYFTIDKDAQIRKSELYNIYWRYCSENSYDAPQCQKFWSMLKAHFNDRGYAFRIKKVKGYEYIEGLKCKEL